MLVPLPGPFDFGLTVERFRAFGPDPVNLWEDGALLRAFDGHEVRMEPAEGGVRIAGPRAVAAPVARFLGGEFDLVAFGEFAVSDPVLARLEPALRGFRPPVVPDPFEALVTSITAQQVSLVAALAIRTRLVRRYGDPAGRVWAFPPRERLAAADDADLTGLGFSRAKARYVLALARSDLDLHALAGLPDDEVAARLTAVPGVGEWTADWFLARHLGRPDAWPAGDLGLRKAVAAFYLDGRDASVREVRELGARFSPFANLAAHYLLTAHRVLGR